MDQLSVWGSGDKEAEKCHPIKQMGSDALTVQPRAKKKTKQKNTLDNVCVSNQLPRKAEPQAMKYCLSLHTVE